MTATEIATILHAVAVLVIAVAIAVAIVRPRRSEQPRMGFAIAPPQKKL